jgi:transposase
MSTNNLLNIKDKNIDIITKSKESKEEMIKNKNYKIVEGILTYIPHLCPHCGIINHSTSDITK